MEWISKVRPQVDSVDRKTSHNPGVIEVGQIRSCRGWPWNTQTRAAPIGSLGLQNLVRAIWRAGPGL